MSSSGTADFAGDCGECKSKEGYFSASCTAGMQINQSATVNGNSPQNCMTANDGATVYEISLQPVAGFYSYQVRVYAQGPSGISSGSMYLAFEDMTGDVYYLSVFVSEKEWHEVSFNSSSPAIKTLYWSDYSFSAATVDESKSKPNYQIVSPARTPNQ